MYTSVDGTKKRERRVRFDSKSIKWLTPSLEKLHGVKNIRNIVTMKKHALMKQIINDKIYLTVAIFKKN